MYECLMSPELPPAPFLSPLLRRYWHPNPLIEALHQFTFSLPEVVTLIESLGLTINTSYFFHTQSHLFFRLRNIMDSDSESYDSGFELDPADRDASRDDDIDPKEIERLKLSKTQDRQRWIVRLQFKQNGPFISTSPL